MEPRVRAKKSGNTGTVYLVGAGPGDPKLITVRAVELLQKADVVLYDRLVSRKILNMAPKSAEKEYVGRAVGDPTTHQNDTNEAMLRHAGRKRRIVRLKGGDPVMFGRGGEEAEFLKRNGIRYEIVPGVTSGIGSATYSGIPLTHRKHSSSVAFVTGHEDPEKKREAVKWRRLAKSVDTIVVMMGLSRIGAICDELVAGGMDPKTPVAVIQDGTTPKHRTITGSLSSIPSKVKRAGVRPPANIIIGSVVGLSGQIGWREDR